MLSLLSLQQEKAKKLKNQLFLDPSQNQGHWASQHPEIWRQVAGFLLGPLTQAEATGATAGRWLEGDCWWLCGLRWQ